MLRLTNGLGVVIAGFIKSFEHRKKCQYSKNSSDKHPIESPKVTILKEKFSVYVVNCDKRECPPWRGPLLMGYPYKEISL